MMCNCVCTFSIYRSYNHNPALTIRNFTLFNIHTMNGRQSASSHEETAKSWFFFSLQYTEYLKDIHVLGVSIACTFLVTLAQMQFYKHFCPRVSSLTATTSFHKSCIVILCLWGSSWFDGATNPSPSQRKRRKAGRQCQTIQWPAKRKIWCSLHLIVNTCSDKNSLNVMYLSSRKSTKLRNRLIAQLGRTT